jgi:hypothetical protein
MLTVNARGHAKVMLLVPLLDPATGVTAVIWSGAAGVFTAAVSSSSPSHPSRRARGIRLARKIV